MAGSQSAAPPVVGLIASGLGEIAQVLTGSGPGAATLLAVIAGSNSDIFFLPPPLRAANPSATPSANPSAYVGASTGISAGRKLD